MVFFKFLHLNRVPLWCGWFHWFCYFWVMTLLSNQKLKTRNTVSGYKEGSKIQSDKIFWSGTPKLWAVSFAIFDSWPFYQAKSWKTQNTVFGYKKSSKIQSDIIFWINGARACVYDKIWKVWTLSFHWKKKLLNLDKNLRFWRKSKFVNSIFFRGIFQKWHVRPKLARFPAFKENWRARVRAPACTWWNSKSMNLQLSLEKNY